MSARLSTGLLLAALGAACTLPDGRRLLPGAEIQAYPAGVIPGFHVQTPVAEREVLTARLAANLTDRDDFGERDDEEGEGFGVGVGWRRYETAARTGWLWGARVDLWDLEIDWVDSPGLSGETRGTTDVLVLQPTVEGGYAWRIGDGGWRLDLAAGLGAEINVDEDGRDVGDGAIFLVGVTLVHDP